MKRPLLSVSKITKAGNQVYYAARNKFERFRGFLELISRFEFEFCRCVNYFFEGFDFFGVFKVQSHTMWPYMCLCCGCLVHPHNSISNVVVSLTIHDNVHIHKTCSKKT